MANNIYEEPGRFRPEPPPSHAPVTTTAQFTTVTVERDEHSASKAAPNPFSCHFQDTFTEATEPKVPDVIHHCYKLTYSYVLKYCYIFLSLLIGPILVVIFGLFLGLTSFLISWLLSPIFRCTGMCFVVWERFITSCLDCCLAPYCRVLGGFCSKMIIRYQKVPPGEVIHV